MRYGSYGGKFCPNTHFYYLASCAKYFLNNLFSREQFQVFQLIVWYTNLCLCELVLKTMVHAGKLDNLAWTGHTSKVVLMNKKLDVEHSVYMDNFFNSYNLAKSLLTKVPTVQEPYRLNEKTHQLVLHRQN